MSRKEGDFRIRPGKVGDRGKGSARRIRRLAAQVKLAANRSGFTRSRRTGTSRRSGSGRNARGRHALATMRQQSGNRRVTVVARIVRHKGAHFRAAPLGRHISYLERDGVTKDGRDASMFGAGGDTADRDGFAARCEDDRHHFRFIVSPEDAHQMEDLHTFTRELMSDMSRDLGTQLDWVAVDHWNTDNPHIHILVRGVADDGTDLVMDRAYVSHGIRTRAEDRVTLELGPRSELEVRAALEREVEAERWTSLDRVLAERARDNAGQVDLRPDPENDDKLQHLLRGRAAKLGNLGLAIKDGPATWTISSDAEYVLRDLSIRGDIIKTVHRAMGSRSFNPSSLVIHPSEPEAAIVGRLIERGHQDELTGSAYAIIDGTDGHVHHVRFDTIELSGDAPTDAIVELRKWEAKDGSARISLATRSDLGLGEQIEARGATWLDRQLVTQERLALGNGFGGEIKAALAARASFLEAEGLGSTIAGRFQPARDLIQNLQTRDLEAAASAIQARTGLSPRPFTAGEDVSGIYRERVTLSSGRFAMIDDGMSFQLVPWRPALDRHLGKQVSGAIGSGGGIEWNLARGRGIGL